MKPVEQQATEDGTPKKTASARRGSRSILSKLRRSGSSDSAANGDAPKRGGASRLADVFRTKAPLSDHATRPGSVKGSHQRRPSLENAGATPKRVVTDASDAPDASERRSFGAAPSIFASTGVSWRQQRRASAPDEMMRSSEAVSHQQAEAKLAKDLMMLHQPGMHRANEVMVMLMEQLSLRTEASADGHGTISKPEVEFLRKTYHTTMTDRRISLMHTASQRLHKQIKSLQDVMDGEFDEDEQALRMICEDESEEDAGSSTSEEEGEEQDAEQEAAADGSSSTKAVRCAGNLQPAERNVLVRLVNEFGNWDFNPFDFAAYCPAAPLVFMGYALFHYSGLCHAFQFDDAKLLGFLTRLDAGYPDNHFHNSLHGCDVAQTLNYMLMHTELKSHIARWMHLAGLIAAISHDVGHIGLTNQFLKETNHDLALTYSYASPLENMHVSRTFTILAKAECNFLDKFSRSRVNELRSMIITMVLATDMAFHGLHLMELEEFIASEAEDLTDPSAAMLVMKSALHCADISNPTKDWQLYSTWADLVLEEFQAQGDLERSKGMPISPGFDREKLQNVKQKASGQLFFIGVLVQPYYAAFCQLPMVDLPEALEHMESNQARWKRIISDFDAATAPPPPPPPPPTAIVRDDTYYMSENILSRLRQRDEMLQTRMQPILDEVQGLDNAFDEEHDEHHYHGANGASQHAQEKFEMQPLGQHFHVTQRRQERCLAILAKLVDHDAALRLSAAPASP